MQLSFTLLPQAYAITRLPSDAPIPAWAGGSDLFSITRAKDELSIVCVANQVPKDVPSEQGWTALKVDTLAELDEPGVVLSAVRPISEAGLGVFVISTHLRDYLLVRSAELARVRTALCAKGHRIA